MAPYARPLSMQAHTRLLCPFLMLLTCTPQHGYYCAWGLPIWCSGPHLHPTPITHVQTCFTPKEQLSERSSICPLSNVAQSLHTHLAPLKRIAHPLPQILRVLD